MPKAPTGLPAITNYEARCVAEWLHSSEQMQRIPMETAKVLVFAVKMHQRKQAWPTRNAAALHCGVSLPLHDMVISQRTATGHLEINLVIKQGAVAKRPSVVKLRYIKPSEELIKVVTGATRRERNSKLRRRELRTKNGARYSGSAA